MHPNPHTTDYTLTAARELLFVGFDEGFDHIIQNFPYQSKNYRLSQENNSFQAYQWMGNRVNALATYQLPYAVLCDLDWLIFDQYRLVKQMLADPDLCSVPFIVFSRKGSPIHNSTLSDNGIDDCYTLPVNWSMVETRIDFLNQFKPRVLEASTQVLRENFRFRIPWQKRIFDLIGATLGILLSSWIWAPVMLAIWLESKGPVVYKSKRVGSGYQVFEFFKFRSMYMGAEEQLHEMQHLNLYQNGAGNNHPVFVKFAHDPRTTRVGRFIRKYSFDELPQLINVLRGDMSLVGNRPLPIYEAESLTRDEWSARFLAPAGITGLWQISKRSRPDMTAEERIGLDIHYSEAKYSVWTDLKIALKTLLVFVQKEDV